MRLLQQIRAAQQVLAGHAADTQRAEIPVPPITDIAAFLSSLSRAWQGGEVRPTHRKPARPARWWRSRVDPFAHTWPVVEQWLETDPTETAATMLERLAEMAPDAYAGQAQLRTLQRRIKQWRLAKAKDLILGQLARSANGRKGPASAVPSLPLHKETSTSPG